MALSQHTTQSLEGKFKIPRLLSEFLKGAITLKPSNKKLILSIFEPMEIEEFCVTWVPIIYPDIDAPTPEDIRRPRGYLQASKNLITALTQSSDSTVENWIYGDRKTPHTLKMYLRTIHVFWLLQGCFVFPVDFPRI